MKKAGKLHSLETPEGLWQEISINIIGPLPKQNDKNAIVVIIDQFTRLKSTTTTVVSEDITKIYQNKIWKIHGVPQKVLSNRKPQFALKFMKDLIKALGTKITLSIVYHPQKDSQTDQINQEVEVFL